jgi:hypothetical protein
MSSNQRQTLTFVELVADQRLKAMHVRGEFQGKRTTMGNLITECSAAFLLTAAVGREFSEWPDIVFAACCGDTEYNGELLIELATAASKILETSPPPAQALDLVIQSERIKAGSPSRIVGQGLGIDITTGRWLAERGPGKVTLEAARELLIDYAQLGVAFGIKFPASIAMPALSNDTAEMREAFAWFCSENCPEYLAPLGLSP